MSTPTSTGTTCTLGLAFALAVLGVGSAQATVYTVGPGGGCTHATVQAAITAAQASPPAADQIRVSTGTYAAQELIVSLNQELDIVGGYASCSATQPTAGSRAILDGQGGNARTVLVAFVDSGSVLRLRNLTLRRGDIAGSGEGGGIYFEGHGRLELSDSTLANNDAGYGGGLFARGYSGSARVVFGPNVTVSGNTARHSGGGVYLDQVTFEMTQPGSGLFSNAALGEGSGGYGGGLMMLVNNRNAYAYIGSGLGSAGAIFGNTAKYGGGVAMFANNATDDGPEAELQMHSPVPGQPAGIRNNIASQQGGGLYLSGHNDPIPSQYSLLRAMFWHAELRGNSAPAGAAIYSDTGGAFNVIRFSGDTTTHPPPGGVLCPTGGFCSGIIDNVAETPDGTATTGAVIHLLDDGNSLAIHTDFLDPPLPARGGALIEGNRGGHLILAGTDASVRIGNALIADNQAQFSLINKEGDGGFLFLRDTTLAGNAIGTGHVALAVAGNDVRLARSILWQPGRTLLQCSGCSRTFERLIVSERGSLDGGSSTQVVVADPRFVDPANGDYRPRAASPAVDHAPTLAGDDRDVLNFARDVDLPIRIGTFGDRDVGAFERQFLQPLVLNGDIDIDTRLWTELIAGTVSRDTPNASGGAGSGSLRVFRLNAPRGQPTIAARQCIHLPGPARYTLNGWARSMPDGFFAPPLDSTQLRWELRHGGGESCTVGAIAASGILPLSSAGWAQAASPAVIDVDAASWTAQTSLLVHLVVIENSVAPNAANAEGWFDGITLGAAALDDVIFANGFQP